jgi:eukaryotic-like serine/threonine-protein kinase
MAPETSKAKPLQTVGNYELIEKIAEGGMGAIYRGRQRDSGMIVAVKIMPVHMAQNPILLKRFEQEFRAASRLDHPNIVRALDYGDAGDQPYLVMEFVEGESLGQKIEREGRMSEAEAIRIIAQVAQGLHRAHKQNLVHRDVKPDNILVRPDGVAKLADLGLVKETDTDLNLTKTGRGLGTPHFMAPEQFRNAKNADSRCDIYSLGATLYQMVTGELPFRSSGPLDAWMKKIQNDLTAPRQIVSTLSERIELAILRAMDADPGKRPASCREFIEELTGKSTRRGVNHEAANVPAELWYLVYRDENGTSHTVKGSVNAIRKSLRDGLLGDADNVRASRTKAGPFESLASYPEFRDLLVTTAPSGPLSGRLQGQPVSGPRSSTGAAGNRPDTPVSSANRTTPQPRPTPADTAPPHIILPPSENPGMAEVIRWGFLVLVALVSGAVAFWLIPWFSHPSR